MTRMSSRRDALAALVVVCALTTPVVWAQAVTQPARISVDYSDLDLTRPAGAATLYRRIERAARTLCGPRDARQLRSDESWRACYGQAVADAVQRIDKPTLTALHRTRTRPAA